VLLQRQRLLLLRDHLRIRGERVSRIRIGNEGRGVRRLLLRFELGECTRLGIIHALLGINERFWSWVLTNDSSSVLTKESMCLVDGTGSGKDQDHTFFIFRLQTSCFRLCEERSSWCSSTVVFARPYHIPYKVVR
jgi:hypothetical protein